MTVSPATPAAALSLARSAPGRVFNMATPLLDRHVGEGRGDRVAVQTNRRTYTYLELQALANRAGNALARAGVDTEQRVAILLPDGVAFLATFLGALKIGAVPVPLNTLAPKDDLLYFLSDSRARALVTTSAMARQIFAGGRTEATRLLKAVLLEDAEPSDEVPADGPLVQSFDAACQSASPDLEAFPTGVDEPCYWLYSSGTTGRPKGTVHLHGDMLACVAPYAEEVVGITPDDVCFSVARLFFSYGLVNSLFLPLLAGASVVLSPDRPEPRHILEVVRRYRPTLFFSVPTSYAQVAAVLDQGEENADRPFGGVRHPISAGEPLPAPLFRRWKDLTGQEILDGVGSTEVGYIFCSNLPGRVRPGSSGQLFGEHEARIVDEHGAEAPVGEDGELLVRSDSVALHYWNQRARSKATFEGEWIRTGDRYVRDADGYYWYLGRTNDIFKVSGQWVSPLDVESCLLEHPSVLECAIVGVADPAGLIKPKAFIVLRQGVHVTEEELQVHVKSRLQPHKYPRWVVFVESLPKTATGKVQRFKLREGWTA